FYIFFFQAEDGIRDRNVTGVQTCALPISIFSELEYEMQEMIVKEENILIPMVTEDFTDEDWMMIADEMDDIGYCIVKLMAKWEPARAKSEMAEESKMQTNRIQLGTGSLSHKELDIILDSLPLELTFVDKDNIVQYYNIQQ